MRVIKQVGGSNCRKIPAYFRLFELVNLILALVLGLAFPFIVVQLLNQVDFLRLTFGNFWFFVLEIASLLLMPAVPVLYGWVSGNRRRSILVGGLCPAGFFYFYGVLSGPAVALASPDQFAGELVRLGLVLLLF